MNYISHVVEVRETPEFSKWIAGAEKKARARILIRIERLKQGLFGDVEPVGEGVSELRIHYGPGYRVYLKRIGREVVLLLCGGDKSTQDRDIARAKKLAVDY